MRANVGQAAGEMLPHTPVRQPIQPQRGKWPPHSPQQPRTQPRPPLKLQLLGPDLRKQKGRWPCTVVGTCLGTTAV